MRNGCDQIARKTFESAECFRWDGKRIRGRPRAGKHLTTSEEHNLVFAKVVLACHAGETPCVSRGV